MIGIYNDDNDQQKVLEDLNSGVNNAIMYLIDTINDRETVIHDLSNKLLI